jgi:hypothetical protein
MPECLDVTDCPDGYGCGYVEMVDYAPTGSGVQLLCTPESGLLDPCDFDSECHGGDCTGSGGYCTNGCAVIDDCALGSFCVDDVSGVPRCHLECFDDTDCTPYGTFCSPEVDTEDYDVDVCYF